MQAPFFGMLLFFFGVTPSDIWRRYGAVVVSKYWTKERNLNPFFFWRDANKYLMKMWNFETYNMQSNSWKHGEKPPGTRMKWPMFPSIPHWQRASKVHVWDEDPRLENGPLNVNSLEKVTSGWWMEVGNVHSILCTPQGKKNRIFNIVCGAYESSTTQVNPLQSSTFFTTLNHNLVNHHSHQSSHIVYNLVNQSSVIT